MSFKKNTAITGFPFGLVDAVDGSDITTGTPVGYYTLDGGTQTAIADTSPAHEGNGQWSINLTATEMNGDLVGLTFTHSSALTAHFTIKTETKLVSELQDISAAIVNTQCDLAISDASLATASSLSNVPTNAELNARTLPTASYFDTTTDIVDANILTINSNTLPVTNLESQYDTTGLIGENFPASQAQLGNISTGSGGISSLTTGTVVTTGNQVGDYTDTFAFDGIYNTFTPVGSIIDFYYETNIGRSAVATSVLWEGYVQSNNDILNVFSWDWVSSVWVQVSTIIASNGVVPLSETFILTNTMTGTGANLGEVRLRFESSTVTSVNTDRILFEYTAIADNAFILHSGVAQAGTTNTLTLDALASSNDGSYIHSRVITTEGTGAEQESIITDYNGTTKVATVEHSWVTVPDNTTSFNITPAQVHTATRSGGYDNAAVYVNGDSGVAGTLIGVNGTSTNPSNNLTDARIIADSQKIQKLSFSGGSILTLDQAYNNFVFDIVQGQLLNLDDQEVSGSVFMRSGITGGMTIIGGVRAIFELCGVVDANLGVCNLLQSGLGGTITLRDLDRYLFWDCFENTGSINPTIDINGDGVTTTNLELLNYEGRVTLSNLTSVDEVVITGNVHVILDSSCNGGNLTYSGDVKVLDNSTSSPTFTNGYIKDINDTTTTILSDTETTIPSLIAALNNFNPATDAVNVGRLLGTLLTETTGARLANNLSTFFDNADANTSKVVDDVGTAVSGGGEFTTTEKNQLRYRLGIDGTAVAPTANPDLSQKSDINSLNDFNPSTDIVANVTLVGTTTTNTDMRGTDNALLDSSYTVAPTVSSIVDGVWDELQSNHTTIGTFGYYLDSRISTISGGGGGSTPAEIWSYATRELTSGDNIVLAKGTGVTGFNDVAATDIVTGGAIDTTSGAVDSVTLVDTTLFNTDMRGTNSALLSSSYEAPDNTSITSILSDTNELQLNQGNWLTATGFNTVAPDNASIASILVDTSTTIPNQIDGLNDLSAAEVWTEQLVESYAADGIAPTATESLMLTQQFLSDFDITTTSYNVKRLDGTSSAATFTINDDTNPTSITRS